MPRISAGQKTSPAKRGVMYAPLSGRERRLPLLSDISSQLEFFSRKQPGLNLY
jgi:hypothetical protein